MVYDVIYVFMTLSCNKQVYDSYKPNPALYTTMSTWSIIYLLPYLSSIRYGLYVAAAKIKDVPVVTVMFYFVIKTKRCILQILHGNVRNEKKKPDPCYKDI